VFSILYLPGGKGPAWGNSVSRKSPVEEGGIGTSKKRPSASSRDVTKKEKAKNRLAGKRPVTTKKRNVDLLHLGREEDAVEDRSHRQDLSRANR